MEVLKEGGGGSRQATKVEETHFVKGIDPSKHHVHWIDIQRLLCLVWPINYVKSDDKSNQAVNLTTTTWERHPCCILICTGSDVFWFW